MEDDTKITVSRTREDGSNEIIWEIGLEEMYKIQQAYPYKTLVPQTRVNAGDYALAISIGKYR